jgi:G:T-mismatch repair DNA endonuclease (very short patch repair protein)
MEKYGEDNPFKSNEIKTKIKETCLEKFGVENPLQSIEVRRRIEQTCIERYGVITPFQSESCREKAKQTCVSRYGVEHPSHAAEIIEKKKKTNLEKYGVEHHIAAPCVREKSLSTLHENFGVDNPMRSDEVKRRYRVAMTVKYGEGIINPSQLADVQTKIKESSMTRYDVVHFTQSEIVKNKQRKAMIEKYGVDSAFKLPSTKIAGHTKAAHKKRIATMRANGANFQSSKVEDRLFKILISAFKEVHRHVEMNGWDIDFYIKDNDTYINMNGIYWHGRDMSNDQLTESSTKQSKTIIGTKMRDALREKWFLENKKKLVIVWEDELESAVQKISS